MKIINPTTLPVAGDIGVSLNELAQSIKRYAHTKCIYPTREKGIGNFLRFNVGGYVCFVAINLPGKQFTQHEIDVIVGYNTIIPVHVVKSAKTAYHLIDWMDKTYPRNTDALLDESTQVPIPLRLEGSIE